MIRLFVGYDPREAVGWHVFVSSVLHRTTLPMQITPVEGPQLDGSNAFTYARFAVPALCGYSGWALFADGSDMLCLADLAELWALRDERYAVQVVKHYDYTTRHPIKYRGTDMECPNRDYPRKNWSSVAIMNCAAPEWQYPPAEGIRLHQFADFAPERIGALPPEWNCLADEGQNSDNAKLLHWTAGTPAFKQYAGAPRAAEWRAEFERMIRV